MQIPSPKLNKSYNAKNYEGDVSSFRNFPSDASSWRLDLSGTADSLFGKSRISSSSSNTGFAQKHLIADGSDNSSEQLEVDDGESSDESDEISCNTWNPSFPPPNKGHHYQDEMKVILSV